VAGWTDWNIALNETGGPSWVPVVRTDSPIIVNVSAMDFSVIEKNERTLILT
jgi:hypothetical protein